MGLYPYFYTLQNSFLRKANFLFLLFVTYLILLFPPFFGRAIFNDRTQKNYCAANSKHDDDEPNSGVVLKNVQIHMHPPPLRLVITC
jgi:hypothetical protein